MPEKTKSYFCEVCGRQSKFTKQTVQPAKGMMGKAYKDNNPIIAASAGIFKMGGAAVNAAKSYRCVVCGSKKGAAAEV
jgi:DNA-directed RNA polymerase subunit RPC12/RpoP